MSADDKAAAAWDDYVSQQQEEKIEQLERELNAANSRIELLMSANADVARIAGERDAAEKRVNRLEAVVNDPHALWANWLRGDVKLPAGIGDVRQYQDRIKRLEEAHSWRLIETAPSNYTWILGYDEEHGETGMIIFERGDESEPHWTDGMREWEPTHWMPLPEPPKSKEDKL